MSFLPISKKEMEQRGWKQPDFICVTGDAYVDHPSFGIAIISRLLEREGYRCVVLAQPNFSSTAVFMLFGKPRLGFLVTSGNIDSMVAHYTAAKRKRSDDAYTPGNVAGKRPDRAAIVYSKLIKEAYPDVPVVLGGLEASLRRFAHYDYWDDAVRPSILVDSGADLLIYGMGEHPITEIARRMNSGEHPGEMTDIPGTCYLAPLNAVLPAGSVSCASFDKV
ncbi:MAG: YgiQ family radical SAM protein, partial [Angelakisella sp.]